MKKGNKVSRLTYDSVERKKKKNTIKTDPVSQINIVRDDTYKKLTEEEGKSKWEKLYYETWRLAILRRWRPDMVNSSREYIEESWQQFRVTVEAEILAETNGRVKSRARSCFDVKNVIVSQCRRWKL